MGQSANIGLPIIAEISFFAAKLPRTFSFPGLTGHSGGMGSTFTFTRRAKVIPVTTESNLDWRDRRIEGIVLDLDGTLTNSIELYFKAFQETGLQFGLTFEREAVLEPLAEGKAPWDRAFPEDLPDRDEKIREFRAASRKGFIKAFKQVRPFAGVDAMLATLTERGLKLGLVTDSTVEALKVLDDHLLAHYFSVMVSQNDGVPRKPEPYGVIRCLKKMGVRPFNAVTVGDALLDIWAGQRAGTLTVGVLTGLATRRQFQEENTTAIVDQVTDILSLWDFD